MILTTLYGLCRRHCSTSSGKLVLNEAHFDGKIVRLVMNSPKTRNALSMKMLEALIEEIDSALKVPSARAIIIAAHPPVFSSGHDLKELTSKSGSVYHAEVFQICTQLMTKIQQAPVPVIAEVKFMAAAAGCQLAATCDIVVAGESAKFATPGAKAGIFCSTPGIAVARSVSPKVAMEMVLVGDPINAQDALRAGLVSRVVADHQVEETAMEISKKICSLSKPVVALGKKFFYEQIEKTRMAAYKDGEKVMVENLRLIDAQEGLKAFAEKRLPVWTHENKTCI